MAAILKNRYDVITPRRSSYYYEIWQADAKWHGDDYTYVKIETGNRIPIWRPSVDFKLLKRMQALALNDPCIFNDFYIMHPESYRIRWHNANLGLLCRSRSFKATNFGTNRKLICDFLLVSNSSLTSYLAPFPIYSLQKVQNHYICLPLLCLTPSPLTEGSLGRSL